MEEGGSMKLSAKSRTAWVLHRDNVLKWLLLICLVCFFAGLVWFIWNVSDDEITLDQPKKAAGVRTMNHASNDQEIEQPRPANKVGNHATSKEVALQRDIREESWRFRFRAMETAEKPLADCQLKIWFECDERPGEVEVGPWERTSDGNGFVTINVGVWSSKIDRPRTIVVEATNGRFLTSRRCLEVPKEPCSHDLGTILVDEFYLRGKILNEWNNPIEGAIVTLWTRRPRGSITSTEGLRAAAVKSGENGEFRFMRNASRLTPYDYIPTWFIVVQAEGYQPVLFRPFMKGNVRASVKLLGAGTVVGQINADSGVDYRQVHVRISREFEGTMWVGARPKRNGFFKISGLPIGKFTISIWLANGKSPVFERKGIEITAGAPFDLGKIDLSSFLMSIAVNVVDRDGRPIPFARIGDVSDNSNVDKAQYVVSNKRGFLELVLDSRETLLCVTAPGFKTREIELKVERRVMLERGYETHVCLTNIQNSEGRFAISLVNNMQVEVSNRAVFDSTGNATLFTFPESDFQPVLWQRTGTTWKRVEIKAMLANVRVSNRPVGIQEITINEDLWTELLLK